MPRFNSLGSITDLAGVALTRPFCCFNLTHRRANAQRATIRRGVGRELTTRENIRALDNPRQGDVRNLARGCRLVRCSKSAAIWGTAVIKSMQRYGTLVARAVHPSGLPSPSLDIRGTSNAAPATRQKLCMKVLEVVILEVAVEAPVMAVVVIEKIVAVVAERARDEGLLRIVGGGSTRTTAPPPRKISPPVPTSRCPCAGRRRIRRASSTADWRPASPRQQQFPDARPSG